MPTREATITEIRWQQPGNAWKRFYTDDPDYPTWTGAIGDAVPGTLLRVEGEIERHEKYGTSFKVSRVISAGLPEGSADQIWLAYRIRHLGDTLAETLLDRYGEKLWDMLAYGHELVNMRGITAERLIEMREDYMAYGHERELVTHLHEHGLPIGQGIKAFNVFGINLPVELAKDPYCLMAVRGLGFPTVDPVALSLGMQPQDPRRICAMAEHELTEELGRGHCWLDRNQLVIKVARATGAKAPAVGDAIYDAPRLVMRSTSVMLSRIEQAERFVAMKLQALIAKENVDLFRHYNTCQECNGSTMIWPGANKKDLCACEDRVLTKAPEIPFCFDPSQIRAVEGMVFERVAVVTGGPGTGKTTTLKVAMALIESQGNQIKLCAPTGKAAKRMSEVCEREATTIHKLLQWSPEGWRVNETEPVQADVVVVDETSMVDIELFASLMRGLGDARLIIVGDVDQLPPVGPGQPLQDIIESGSMPVYTLTETHRQAGDSWVIDNAAKIIAGHKPDLSEGGGFEHVACTESDDIVRRVVGLYTQHRALQVLTPEHKKGAGTTALNLAVQRAVNPKRSDFEATIKANGYEIYRDDKVLYTRNNMELGLVNGDMGYVVSVDSSGDRPIVVVDFEGIESDQAHGYWYLSGGDVAPLTLAYAMTIHKSQGSEWDHVVVITDPEHWSLARRLFYTAVTRTSDKLTVVGCEDAVERACASTRNLSRRTLLQQRLNGELNSE